jgi:hypothetical protein
MLTTTTDYVPRALAAWYRASRTGHTRAFPSQALCEQVTLANGKAYVVMANSNAVLGVYRIRPSGFLRLLKRWPRAVEVAAGWTTDERGENDGSIADRTR